MKRIAKLVSIFCRTFLTLFVLFVLIIWFRRASPLRQIAPYTRIDFDKRARSNSLMEAVRKDDLARVTNLLRAGVSANSIDDLGEDNTEAKSALDAAAGTGDVKMVRLLLSYGAEVNLPDFWGGTAITAAAVGGKPDVIRLLIERGADVNTVDDGTRPLDYAMGGLAQAKSASERLSFGRVVDELSSAGARTSLLGL